MNASAHAPAHLVAHRIRSASIWLVRSDDNVVGPVSIELIERGIAAGKIPDDAEMAYAGGGEWQRVLDIFPPCDDTAPEPSPSLLPPVSVRYPEEPVSIPKQGLLTALFR